MEVGWGAGSEACSDRVRAHIGKWDGWEGVGGGGEGVGGGGKGARFGFRIFDRNRFWGSSFLRFRVSPFWVSRLWDAGIRVLWSPVGFRVVSCRFGFRGFLRFGFTVSSAVRGPRF